MTAAVSAHGDAIPAGGEDLLAKPFPEGVRFSHRGDPDAEQQVVDVKDQPFDKAVRVTTTKRPDKPWNIVMHVPTNGQIKSGDVVLLSLRMRTLKSEDESGDGVALAMLERNRAPHWNVVAARATAGKAWRYIVAANIAPKVLAADEHQVAIHLGYHPQSVEIADLRVINYGSERRLDEMPATKQTYKGREPDAAWRKAAFERIEKYRKTELTVRVVDADGKPVPGAKVRVEQQRHAFGFGSVVALHPMTDEGPDGVKYRALVKRHFNKAPTESGFRWPTWERGTPEWRAGFRQKLDQTINWLNENGIEVRGHYLMWAPIEERNKPIELIDKPDQLLEAKWKHAEEMATWAGKRVSEWDAINHIAGWGTTFADVCGGNKVYAEMIQRGRKWAPHAEMWINEGQILVGDGSRIEDYEKIIEDLIAMDAKPDGIGFMAHFRDTGLPHPRTVYDRIDRFAKFDCKLQLTEFDVDCGLDEQLQADYKRDVMVAAFSHPKVEGIVMWGFWEGRHWRPAAALWRKDWSIKPAGEAWVDLVFRQWWTDEVLTTDAQGVARTRAFFGTHRLSTPGDEKTIDLTEGPMTVILKQRSQ